MREIDKYMTVNEAAERYGINVNTIKNRLKPSLPKYWKETNEMIEEGLLKFYQKGQRKEWIISEEAIKRWFGK